MTLCYKCGKPVEHARECYATPVCYACLTPPPPLEVIEVAPLSPQRGGHLTNDVGECVSWCPECQQLHHHACQWPHVVVCVNCGRTINERNCMEQPSKVSHAICANGCVWNPCTVSGPECSLIPWFCSEVWCYTCYASPEDSNRCDGTAGFTPHYPCTVSGPATPSEDMAGLLDEVDRLRAEVDRLRGEQSLTLWEAEASCEVMEAKEDCECAGCVEANRRMELGIESP